MAAIRIVCVLVVLAAAAAHAAEPLRNVSQIVERRGMPVRVHVFEDYETDIEKRWRMAGEATTENVPESTSASRPNTRCCRATETKNFDRKMEDQNTVWKAVIFNPVPGPPMGPRTRLGFRYRLVGTDSLRVQIYSLTNNYHRYLTLTNLPQQTWQAATVDMTAARRPDGTGGPLSTDERIDDIQFYVPREADLWIDDIVLYEEAAADETRPFPARFLFTGWFDTGKQGQEWPGDFEIALHEKPQTWDFARSVVNAATNEPWIRLHLRGPRPLSQLNEVCFRYQLTGGDKLLLRLTDGKSPPLEASVAEPIRGRWTETTVPLRSAVEGAFAEELHFLTGAGGTLLIDDVLIYEPAR